MGRRMRCNGCGRACDNYSKFMLNASATERVCTDCEAGGALNNPPAAASVPQSARSQQQQQYAPQAQQQQYAPSAQQQHSESPVEQSPARSEPPQEHHAAAHGGAQPAAPAGGADHPDDCLLLEGRYYHPDNAGYFAFSLESGQAYYTQGTPDGAVEYFGTFVEGTLQEDDGTVRPVAQVHWAKQVTWEGPDDEHMEGFEAQVDQKAEVDVVDRGLAIELRGNKYYHESLDHDGGATQ